MTNKIIILIGLIIALAITVAVFVKNKDNGLNLTTEEKQIVEEDNNIYKDESLGLAIALPAGWVAKPYPIASTTVFISPVDFKFPDAWGGPLTPITVTQSEGGSLEEIISRWTSDDYADLVLTHETINGLDAVRIKGVPLGIAYIGGRYMEIVSMKKNNKILSVSYYDGDASPDYLSEFNYIVKRIEF